ncbi:DNA-directed RNA polymerase I subunit RPA49-like [Asterias rubens]|uniref:DNA-directed RNA polymerase I subunit RPA49-like n=1 Tax=Asterias rubens TaxID=7604 RepID=UPI001455CE10|nr:DNA-directed RNA polymerase I subunit RPA49-like [Asterias rubens]
MAASVEYFPRGEEGDDELILANFSHGRLNVNDDGACLQPPSFSYFKHRDQADKRRKNQRILVAESNSMQYIGQNFGIHAPRLSSHCKYLVGVLDKESGKMKVYDAKSHQLRPWFGDSSKASECITEGGEQEKLTYSEKNDRLTEAFGSSRKQRALESRLRSAVTPKALETLANKAIEHAQTQPQSAYPSDDEADSGGILPPCNQKAEFLRDVYNLDDIIAPLWMEEVLKLPLTSEFIDATDEQITEWQTEEKYCEYILDRLSRFPRSAAEERQEAACILAYIHYLRKISALGYQDMKTKQVIIDKDLPKSFNDHLVNMFTKTSASVDGVRSRRLFPKQLKEKSLIQMLTLALIVDEFKTDLSLLQKGLTAHLTMLRNHAKALGCRVKESKSATRKKSILEKQSMLNCVTAELQLPRKYKKRPSKRPSSN